MSKQHVYAQKVMEKVYRDEDHSKMKLVVTVKWAAFANQEPYLSITCDEYEQRKNGRWVDVGGGANHELIVRHFPELAVLVPYHLVSAKQPLHYVANAVYHAVDGKEEYVRSTAVWPEFRLADYQTDAEGPINLKEPWRIDTEEEAVVNGIDVKRLREDLIERLPALMERFVRDVRAWGLPIALEAPYVEDEG